MKIAPAVICIALATMGFTQNPTPASHLKKAKLAEQQSAPPTQAQNAASLTIAPNVTQELAEWKTVDMPFNTRGLSQQEQNMIRKLVDACNDLEQIYWQQSDPGALEIYRELAGEKSTTPDAQNARRLLFINGSRYDLLDNNKPFIGTEPMPPGRGFYPQGLTRELIEQYVAAHPDKKDQIYSPYTVVKREGDQLTAVPYHEEYKDLLQAAAQSLRQAADLSPDVGFANFLRLRAQALLDDDYYRSDVLWLDLKNPKVDVIFAPYETYLDDLLGVKTSYGPAVLIRNEAESKKLDVFQEYVPAIQDSLPLPPEDRPSKKGQRTPMEVMDAPFRTGDMLHGYQSVADNLPNDPRIHQEKGTKKIFFKNFMDARVNYVILPIAKRMMPPEQATKATGAGYLAGTMMHEICHGLGPAFARVNGKQVDIREAIGPLYSGLEEAKADVVGMFALKWLVDRNVLPKQKLEEYYTSYVAGNLRTVRFSVAEAHGRAEMMEFNYLSEQGAIRRDAQGRYTVDYTRMPNAIAALAKELLVIEATGDRARAEKWFAKYQEMPTQLKQDLQKVNDVPVDIFPKFSVKVVTE